jgi:8-oxo-dGTP pyrophosphatase MutT (NUDIX family)
VASRGELWQRRIRRELARPPLRTDAKAALRARVVGKPSAEFESLLESPFRRAAVLIGLAERGAQLHLLLTERALHLPDHPGQVAFPGGRLSADETPAAAALREADEEIGLAASAVDVLGELPAQLTVTGFEVTPVVGWLAPGFAPVPDPSEVASVFEVPLEHLLLPASHRRSTRERWGTQFVTEEYLYERFRIWGATATILRTFFEVIDAKTI